MKNDIFGGKILWSLPITTGTHISDCRSDRGDSSCM